MPKDPDPLEVAAALRVSIGLFVRRLRQQPGPGEVTLPEMSILSRLDRAGSATPSALARAEQVTPQAVGARLSTLGERGLVEHQPDPSDGRRIVFSLTSAGRRAVHDTRSAQTGQLAQILAGRFTARELEVLLAAAPLIERLGESI
jgi:DNA-binding MarR family transcriptional regulator